MAVIVWRGDAKGVAQVDVQTIGGTAAIGSYFEATCNGKSLRYTVPATATGDLLQDLIDGFILAWADNANAENGIGEFMEVAVEQYDTAKLSFTSLIPGQPFTFTYACGGGATGPTTDVTNSVANSGPKVASVVANYSSGALPVNGDELWFDDASNGPEFGLTALAGITLAKVVFTENFTGNVGRPKRIEIGRTTYIEYRDRYLQIQPSSGTAPVIVNCPSALMRLDFMTYETLLQVTNTGSRDGETPALCVKGSNANNDYVVDRGSVGVGYFPGETATVLTLRMGYIDQVESDAEVSIGSGVTLGTVNMVGGTLECDSAITTLTQRAGVSRLAGNVTTATIFAGVYKYTGTGTITTLTAHREAEIFWNESNQARTVTNTTIHVGARWEDPGATVTHTNAISIPGGSPTQIVGTFGVGRSASLSFSA